MKRIAKTMFNYIANRQLVLRTLIIIFGVSALTIISPRPVLADVVIIRTSGNGMLTPPAPTIFPGAVAQFDKTLLNLNNFDMDILVTGIAAGGDTVIRLNERVFNGTGSTWSDYHFTLGTGGFGAVPFAQSTEFDNLSFFIVTNVGGNFKTRIIDHVNPDNVSFFDGNGVDPGTFTTFSVTIIVPDLIDGLADGTARFTLRQQASVPEPATMLLLGTGLVGVAMKMRKKLKHRKSG